MAASCVDGFGRKINYLRVSITDRCNLRCVYCMPEEGVTWLPHEDILRYEEIERIVRVGTGMGIDRVRVTGGEPLVRRGVTGFIGRLSAIKGLHDLSLTTNGVRLPEMAAGLAEAGLNRVNISLDTLRPERFAEVSRVDAHERVLAGVEAALGAGLRPVKLNVVVMRGFNDGEVADFAALTLERPLHVRFIELMPLGESGKLEEDRFVPSAEIKARLEERRPLLSPPPVPGQGPAQYYRWGHGAMGTVGFISAISEHFCASCNRLRLTADGRLHPCLAMDRTVDIRGALRSGVDDDELAAVIAQAIGRKPRRHHMTAGLGGTVAQAAAMDASGDAGAEGPAEPGEPGSEAAVDSEEIKRRRMFRIGG